MFLRSNTSISIVLNKVMAPSKKKSGSTARSKDNPSRKKLKASSARWMERQQKDPYVKAANQHGYRSRAAYKLIELDKKFKIFRPGQTVLDLGAAPGSWTQVAVECVQPKPGESSGVISVDISPITPIRGAITMEMDFLSSGAASEISKILPRQLDVVLSDMAAPSTGHRQTDALRVNVLCETALEFAMEALAPGGAFVAKVLKIGAEQHLVEQMKMNFKLVRHAKPPASRKESSESYVVALGYRL